VIVSYIQRRKRGLFYSAKNMAVPFTSHVNLMNENTLSEPKHQMKVGANVYQM